MPTEQNALLNLQTAAKNVRIKLDLPDSPLDWTYEQRITYNKDLSALILAHQQSFTPSMIDTAQDVQNKSYQPLEDPSSAWGGFGAEVFSNGLTLGKAASFISIVVGLIVIGKEIFKK